MKTGDAVSRGGYGGPKAERKRETNEEDEKR